MLVKDAASPKRLRVECWILNPSADLCHRRKYYSQDLRKPKEHVLQSEFTIRARRLLPDHFSKDHCSHVQSRMWLEHVFRCVAPEDQLLQYMDVLIVVAVKHEVL